MPQVFSTQEIRYDWSPDMREVEDRLRRLEEYYENEASLYTQAEFIGIRDMHHKFDTQSDPSGTPWTALVEPQRPHAHDILQLSYDMRNAATDPANWEATPVGLFFDTSNMPWSKSKGQKVSIQYYEKHDPGGGRLPAREFIDLTEEAKTSLTTLFTEWTEGGMDIWGTGIRPLTRSPLGQFARFE